MKLNLNVSVFKTSGAIMVRLYHLNLVGARIPGLKFLFHEVQESIGDFPASAPRDLPAARRYIGKVGQHP